MYKEALSATESLSQPARGFVKPQEEIVSSTGVVSIPKGVTNIVAQNNFIIEILVSLAKQLDKIENKVKSLESKVSAPATSRSRKGRRKS